MVIDHEEDESERGCARNLLDQDHDEDDDNEFDIYGDNDYNDNEFEKETSQAAPEGTYTGAVDVLKKLLKSEGPVALYKGCVPILLRCDNYHDNDDDGDVDDHDIDSFDYLYMGCDWILPRFYDDYNRCALVSYIVQS